MDTLQRSAHQGEENGCKSQSSPVETQLDNWDGHNADSSRPIAESQDEDSIEDKYQVQHNSDDHDQCSDHNSQYPFEIIVIKSELVVEEEEHVGIVEGGLQVEKEEIVEGTLIKQEHIKEGNEKNMKKVESDGVYNSSSEVTDASHIAPHIDTHNGERPHICEICDRTFTRKSYLTIHLHTHTGERPYSCEFCDRTFTRKSYLTIHLHTHTGERPYSCKICDRAFTHKSDLTRHSRTHTGERPYSCEFCDKTFTQKSHLSRHLLTHTGEKPYTCEFCNKTFSDKSNLSNHLRTHTGERPYSCEFCGKSFTHKSHLPRHLNTHTREIAHICEFCGKLFNDRSCLARHSHTHTRETLHPTLLTHTGEKSANKNTASDSNL